MLAVGVTFGVPVRRGLRTAADGRNRPAGAALLVGIIGILSYRLGLLAPGSSGLWFACSGPRWRRAAAVTPVPGTLPPTTQTTINNGAGDQTDPHVSGNLVPYTSRSVSPQ